MELGVVTVKEEVLDMLSALNNRLTDMDRKFELQDGKNKESRNALLDMINKLNERVTLLEQYVKVVEDKSLQKNNQCIQRENAAFEAQEIESASLNRGR